MLNWFTQRRRNRRKATLLYGSIVALSRRPELYAGYRVGDTLEGRFEALIMHMFLYLERLRRTGEDHGAIAQELVDAFFADMDVTQRQAGVGDLAVPKKMRQLAVHFELRMKEYQSAVDETDNRALESLLQSAFFPETTPGNEVVELAGYMRKALITLDQLTLDALGEPETVIEAMTDPAISTAGGGEAEKR